MRRFDSDDDAAFVADWLRRNLVNCSECGGDGWSVECQAEGCMNGKVCPPEKRAKWLEVTS